MGGVELEIRSVAKQGIYYLSKKSWPILYSKLSYEIGQDFFDI